MATGTVKWFEAGLRGLNEGQKVNYEVVSDRRTGKSSAGNLSVAG
jgi:CspA family cold shock protein